MSRPEELPQQSASILSAVDEKKEVSSPAESIRSNEPADDELEPGPEDGPELEPVTTKAHSVNHIGSIPNGGLRAWLQVAGSFFLFFNSWGIINTFGSYQTFYETDLLRNSTPSAISWIGSIQSFLLMIVGTATGPVYDAGYFRELLLGGSLLLVIGQMMLSLCKEYWQVLLAQAFCMGIGSGTLFVPSVAILSTYFTTRIATATGIAAAGSSFDGLIRSPGGVIYPIVFHQLQPKIGFAWTTRVIGFIILATILVPNTVMKVRVLPAQKRAILDLPAFKEIPYTVFIIGGFIGFMGLYMPFFYVQLYAIRDNITNANFAFYLLAILNSASIFGRIIPNILADKIGPFNVLIPAAGISGIICLCLIPIKTTASLIALCALYGFFSGGFVSLPPTIIVHLSLKNRGKIGTRLGMCFGIIAFGILIGAPIGGVILGSHGFTSIWVFGGVLMVSGSCIMGLSRCTHVGWKLLVKG
ncbi:MFS general substrate transporter [Lepidopterella palustris CBS 459.81]|uniref:MFS general substrate transporter n=1 Tax=Lepidopterella palustris CBS 459.81 TaxID=1314670 RepID=A0A8E2EM66_9PEZI|nr:MFS general substrate transporter [Lepidopterella palustris CBS 459.81]